jgi:hypothetical protein
MGETKLINDVSEKFGATSCVRLCEFSGSEELNHGVLRFSQRASYWPCHFSLAGYVPDLLGFRASRYAIPNASPT